MLIDELRVELVEAERALAKLRDEMDAMVDKLGCVPVEQAVMFAHRLEIANDRIRHLQGAIRTAAGED